MIPEPKKVRVVLNSNFPQATQVFLDGDNPIDLTQECLIQFPIKIEITSKGAFVHLIMDAKVDVLGELKTNE